MRIKIAPIKKFEDIAEMFAASVKKTPGAHHGYRIKGRLEIDTESGGGGEVGLAQFRQIVDAGGRITWGRTGGGDWEVEIWSEYYPPAGEGPAAAGRGQPTDEENGGMEA